MEKVKEIELLQSLKGDTYFAQLFDDKQIDTMCENIKNDYPIELGLNLFLNSPIINENTELKKRLAYRQECEETAAKDILIKAHEYSDDSLQDLAESLVGFERCVAIKLHNAIPLSDEDRDFLLEILKK